MARKEFRGRTATVYLPAGEILTAWQKEAAEGGATISEYIVEMVEKARRPTLLTAYPGRLTLHHADLYRLRGDGDELELGLEELPGARGVLAVEWAERLPPGSWGRAYRVSLEHRGEDRRRIVIERDGE